MADSISLTRISTARIGNVGAGEETAISFFAPANLLRNDGDCLFIHAHSVLAANANAKTTTVKIGGTTVAGRSATDNNSSHDMYVRAYKRGNGLWVVGLTANLVTATQIVAQTDIAAVSFAQPLEIKLTQQGVAANDLVSRVLMYDYIPVQSNFGIL